MLRRIIPGPIVFCLATALSGCATAPRDRVAYAFEIGVDPSLSYATNIRYQYGELAEGTKPIAKPIGAPFAVARLEMTIPNDFEIAWDTPDGQSHNVTVPVRSRLKSSIKGKALLFLISHDSVHGYVVTQTDMGDQREQFY